MSAFNQPAVIDSQVLRTPSGIAVSLDVYRRSEQETALIICPGWFQSKDTLTFRRMGQALSQDHHVLAMDFRGHGRSGGFYTFSALESEDLSTVLRWAGERYRQVGVLGFSLGGAIAINVLARDPELAQTVIAVCAPAAFGDIEFKFWTLEAMRTGLRGLEWGAGFRPGHPLLRKERPVDNVSRLAGRSILLIHGARDAIISERHSRLLYAAAKEPKRLVIVPDGGHAEALFRADPVFFSGLVRSWLSETLLQPV